MKWFVLGAICLGGCAGLSTRLPDVSEAALMSEQQGQERQLFKQRAVHYDKLARIAHTVLMANADLCRKTGPDIGVVTHSLKSYQKSLRPAARREFSINDSPKVAYVRPGSPAALIGVKLGDELEGPSGMVLSAPSKMLTNILTTGDDVVWVHDGKRQTAAVTPDTRCDYIVRLKMSGAVNAYANGKAITVTAGMMEFVESDAELALIIAHELAHNEEKHIRKIITNYVLSLGGSRYARPFESEADYVGLYYMARAGYNLDNIEHIWRRLAKTNARSIARAKTHPTFPDRYVQLSAARDEIYAKQALGHALVPRRKDAP